ncbi:MAG: hypothetical protein P1U74_02780 [Legionellaceae bacterium]|nr:hypothetical protein [Legionellaceae bacterium]
MRNKDGDKKDIPASTNLSKEQNKIDEIEALRAFYQLKKNNFWFRIFMPESLKQALSAESFSRDAVYNAYFTFKTRMFILFGLYDVFKAFRNAPATQDFLNMQGQLAAIVPDYIKEHKLNESTYKDSIPPDSSTIEFKKMILSFLSNTEHLEYPKKYSVEFATKLTRINESNLEILRQIVPENFREYVDSVELHNITSNQQINNLRYVITEIVNNNPNEVLQIIEYLLKNNLVSRSSSSQTIPIYMLKNVLRIKNKDVVVERIKKAQGSILSDDVSPMRVGDMTLLLASEIVDSKPHLVQGTAKPHKDRKSNTLNVRQTNTDKDNLAHIVPLVSEVIDDLDEGFVMRKQESPVSKITSKLKPEFLKMDCTEIEAFLSQAICWVKLTARNKERYIDKLSILSLEDQESFKDIVLDYSSILTPSVLSMLIDTPSQSNFKSIFNVLRRINKACLQERSGWRMTPDFFENIVTNPDMDGLNLLLDKLFKRDVMQKAIQYFFEGRELSKQEILNNILDHKPNKQELIFYKNCLGEIPMSKENINFMHVFYDHYRFRDDVMQKFSESPKLLLEIFRNQKGTSFFEKNLSVILQSKDLAKLSFRVAALKERGLGAVLSMNEHVYNLIMLDDDNFDAFLQASVFFNSSFSNHDEDRNAPFSTDMIVRAFREISPLDKSWKDISLILQVLNESSRKISHQTIRSGELGLLDMSEQKLSLLLKRVKQLKAKGFEPEYFTLSFLTKISGMDEANFSTFKNIDKKLGQGRIIQILVQADTDNPALKIKKSLDILGRLALSENIKFDILFYSDLLDTTIENLGHALDNVKKLSTNSSKAFSYLLNKDLAEHERVEAFLYHAMPIILSSKFLKENPAEFVKLIRTICRKGKAEKNAEAALLSASKDRKSAEKNKADTTEELAAERRAREDLSEARLEPEEFFEYVIKHASIIFNSPFAISQPEYFEKMFKNYFSSPKMNSFFTKNMDILLSSNNLACLGSSFEKFDLNSQKHLLEMIIEYDNQGEKLGIIFQILQDTGLPESAWLEILEKSSLCELDENYLRQMKANTSQFKQAQVQAINDFYNDSETMDSCITDITTILDYNNNEILEYLEANTITIKRNDSSLGTVNSFFSENGLNTKYQSAIVENTRYQQNWDDVSRILLIFMKRDLLDDNLMVNIDKLLDTVVKKAESPKPARRRGLFDNMTYKVDEILGTSSDKSTVVVDDYIQEVSELVMSNEQSDPDLLEKILIHADIKPAVRIFQQLSNFVSIADKERINDAKNKLFKLSYEQQCELQKCLDILNKPKNVSLLTAENICLAVDAAGHPIFSDLQEFDKMISGEMQLQQRDFRSILADSRTRPNEKLKADLAKYKSVNISSQLNSATVSAEKSIKKKVDYTFNAARGMMSGGAVGWFKRGKENRTSSNEQTSQEIESNKRQSDPRNQQ